MTTNCTKCVKPLYSCDCDKEILGHYKKISKEANMSIKEMWEQANGYKSEPQTSEEVKEDIEVKGKLCKECMFYEHGSVSDMQAYDAKNPHNCAAIDILKIAECCRLNNSLSIIYYHLDPDKEMCSIGKVIELLKKDTV